MNESTPVQPAHGVYANDPSALNDSEPFDGPDARLAYSEPPSWSLSLPSTPGPVTVSVSPAYMLNPSSLAVGAPATPIVTVAVLLLPPDPDAT